ncbi:uncharacterized protein [Struthio camelus]|uniref:uncharacterized protein n=1 Tax=Struthio camelus TaxID=8801 RepID=UPI003603B838
MGQRSVSSSACALASSPRSSEVIATLLRTAGGRKHLPWLQPPRPCPPEPSVLPCLARCLPAEPREMLSAGWSVRQDAAFRAAPALEGSESGCRQLRPGYSYCSGFPAVLDGEGCWEELVPLESPFRRRAVPCLCCTVEAFVGSERDEAELEPTGLSPWGRKLLAARSEERLLQRLCRGEELSWVRRGGACSRRCVPVPAEGVKQHTEPLLGCGSLYRCWRL